MYSSIENRTDKEVGNIFPQVACLNQELAHSIQFDEFSNLDSELLFNLEPKAKLTDVLSQATISAQGLLINKKCRDIISDFKLINHRYYKCLIKDAKGATYEYFWLHLVENLQNLNWLDYSNSTFYTKQYGFRENDIPITSYKDYCKKSSELGDMGTIKIEKIKLKKIASHIGDLFTIPLLSREIYISEKLKQNLNILNVTGLIIEEAFS